MFKPEAIYDTIYIGNQLEKKLTDFSQYEIQLFSYLSCLLSLYDGNPIAYWGYGFIKNELGSPFSIDLNESIETLIGRGSLTSSNDSFLKLGDLGKSDITSLSMFPSYQKRLKYLEPACQSIKLLPYGIVKDSIIREPVLKYANSHKNKRLLTDEESPAFSLLYEQFEMLREALENKYQNLIIPAVVWLEYLAENKIEIVNDTQ